MHPTVGVVTNVLARPFLSGAAPLGCLVHHLDNWSVFMEYLPCMPLHYEHMPESAYACILILRVADCNYHVRFERGGAKKQIFRKYLI